MIISSLEKLSQHHKRPISKSESLHLKPQLLDITQWTGTLSNDLPDPNQNDLILKFYHLIRDQIYVSDPLYSEASLNAVPEGYEAKWIRPNERFCGDIVEYGNSLLVIGGFDDVEQMVYEDIIEYKFENGEFVGIEQWKTTGDEFPCVYNHTVRIVNDKMWVFGGAQSDRFQLFCVDLVTRECKDFTMEQRGIVPPPEMPCEAVLVEDRYAVICSKRQKDAIPNGFIYLFNFLTMTWSRFTVPNTPFDFIIHPLFNDVVIGVYSDDLTMKKTNHKNFQLIYLHPETSQLVIHAEEKKHKQTFHLWKRFTRVNERKQLLEIGYQHRIGLFSLQDRFLVVHDGYSCFVFDLFGHRQIRSRMAIRKKVTGPTKRSQVFEFYRDLLSGEKKEKKRQMKEQKELLKLEMERINTVEISETEERGILNEKKLSVNQVGAKEISNPVFSGKENVPVVNGKRKRQSERVSKKAKLNNNLDENKGQSMNKEFIDKDPGRSMNVEFTDEDKENIGKQKKSNTTNKSTRMRISRRVHSK